MSLTLILSRAGRQEGSKCCWPLDRANICTLTEAQVEYRLFYAKGTSTACLRSGGVDFHLLLRLSCGCNLSPEAGEVVAEDVALDRLQAAVADQALGPALLQALVLVQLPLARLRNQHDMQPAIYTAIYISVDNSM